MGEQAHAAVLHLDGIDRVALIEKKSGVFDCPPVGEHALLAGVRHPLRIAGALSARLSCTRLEPLSRSAAARIYRNWLSLLCPQQAVPVAPRLRRTGARASRALSIAMKAPDEKP